MTIEFIVMFARLLDTRSAYKNQFISIYQQQKFENEVLKTNTFYSNTKKHKILEYI